jgi:hypothetical protein
VTAPSRGPGGPGAGEPGGAGAPADTEIERLRTENAELRARIARLPGAGAEDRGPRRRPRRLRGAAVAVAVALAAVSFTGALVGAWARRSLLNEQVFAQRAAAIGADPAVRAAVAAYLTDQVMTVADPRALFEQALPERGKVLAAPLASAVRGFVGDRITAFTESDDFTRLWTRVATTGHHELIRVIRRESEVVSARGDTVVVDLVPVINAALARIGEISPELFGRPIDLPTLTADNVPEGARRRLAAVLGRDLSPQFGVIEIRGGGDALRAAQDGVRLFDVLVWFLAVAAVGSAALALWLSDRRRRTLLQLTVALAVATVLARRLALGLTGELLAQVRDANRAAATVIAGVFVQPLLDATHVVLVVLLAVAVVALISGPYRPAVWLRGQVRRRLAGAAAAVGRSASDHAGNGAVDWARGHRGALQGIGAGVALVVLVLADLSWPGVIALAVLSSAYLAVVSWLSGPGAQPSANGTPLP